MSRRGFTLIEVLVALAIAAIGLASVLAVVGNSSRNASYLRDKTFATWIALNQITDVRLGTALPSVDRTDGELDYAGSKWKWQRTVTQTEVPGMRRLDVSVRYAEAADDAWLATLTGFVGRAQQSTQPSSTQWEFDNGARIGGGIPGAPAPTGAPQPTPTTTGGGGSP